MSRMNEPKGGAEATAKMREAAGQVGQGAREMGSQARQAAREQYDNLREQAQEYYEQGREKLSEYQESLESYIREQPVKKRRSCFCRWLA